MSGGEMFYLLLVVASFVVFAVGLAYQSRQQSRLSAEFPASKVPAAPQVAAQHA